MQLELWQFLQFILLCINKVKMENVPYKFKDSQTYLYAAATGALSYGGYTLFGDRMLNIVGVFAVTGLSSAIVQVLTKYNWELKNNPFEAGLLGSLVALQSGIAGGLTYYGINQVAPNFGPGGNLFISGTVGSLLGYYLLSF